jgi:hypothetical protein
MDKKSTNPMQDEFRRFMHAPESEVPAELTEAIFERVHALIHPSAKNVFMKIAAIHAVTGFLSLAVCHQFGMNPFGTSISLYDWFMKSGSHNLCMFACGMFFIGLSFFTAGFFLTAEELAKAKRTKWAQGLLLSFISIIIFTALGAQIGLTIGLFWICGSMLGASMATDFISITARKHTFCTML